MHVTSLEAQHDATTVLLHGMTPDRARIIRLVFTTTQEDHPTLTLADFVHSLILEGMRSLMAEAAMEANKTKLTPRDIGG